MGMHNSIKVTAGKRVDIYATYDSNDDDDQGELKGGSD